jgi:hypothetical protein
MIEVMIAIVLFILLPLSVFVLHVWLMVVDLHDALASSSSIEDDVIGEDPELMGG